MKSIIKNFIPNKAFTEVEKLLDENNFTLKIVNQRQTKHGDFRKLPNGKFQITVNNNLNPYQFLLTLIHEIAHHITFQKYGRVKPHGVEWKITFQRLMLPFLKPEIYPNHILYPLANYLKNPKASTVTDVNLSLALRNYQATEGKNFIFEIPLHQKFIYNKKLYKRGEKRRTRYQCVELSSKLVYLFNQNTEVTLYEEQ